MKILRTPDHRFNGLSDYPFEPNYTVIKTQDGTDLRIHHIDEGPADGPVLLAMHGQPVWSYLYSRMIPHLVKAGIRVIAPDLPGYGKSDKPAAREDYSYQAQVDWMNQWLVQNDFSELTFFGQDWGGLIGLRMVADNGDRFDRVAMGNTGLPYSPNVPQEIVDEILAFRAGPDKITMASMAKQVSKMDGFGGVDPYLGIRKFAYWQKYTWDAINPPAGIIASSMMEKRNKLAVAFELAGINLGLSKMSPFGSSISKAFEAPFPSAAFKMAVRAMPSQVPSIPDRSLEAQKKAWDFFSAFEKPFLCVGAGDDPVTNGFEKLFLAKVPGTKGQPHEMIGGGHFFQWTRAEKLSEILAKFIKAND
jgi:haloalkane dehalogenase